MQRKKYLIYRTETSYSRVKESIGRRRKRNGGRMRLNRECMLGKRKYQVKKELVLVWFCLWTTMNQKSVKFKCLLFIVFYIRIYIRFSMIMLLVLIVEWSESYQTNGQCAVVVVRANSWPAKITAS